MEMSNKFIWEKIIICSAWKILVQRDFFLLYEDVKFEEKYSEHIFYKRKYTIYHWFGHECGEHCYNLCNICLSYTICFNIVFCEKHGWSDYITE